MDAGEPVPTVVTNLSATGAEKPRKAETTGALSTPVNVILALAPSSTIRVSSTAAPSRSNARVRPSVSSRPTTTGVGSGFLVGWPGVGGVSCASSRVRVRLAGS